MILIVCSVFYIILVCVFSYLQGTLNSHSMSEKKKKLPQLVTVQFLLVLTLTGYALIVQNQLAKVLSHHKGYIFVIWILIVYSFIILHRLFKGQGAKKEKESAIPLMRFLQILFTPFTFFIRIPVFNETPEVTEEDILEMIQTSQKTGHMEEPQKELFENVFEFDDTSVEEICTHRSEVVCLFLDDPMEKWQKIIHDNRHTFYPVCQEDEDDVIGILDTRDYFRIDNLEQDHVLAHAMDKPLFVLENTKADECFKEMKKRKYYFAVVIDEYGGMSGIVTLHDIVETILGEMYEEDEEEPEEIQVLDSNSYRIYGSCSLEDVQEALHIELPTEDYDTFGGYILGCNGSIPDDGEQFDLHLEQMDITVKEIKNHRVLETIVNVKKKEETKNETITGNN